MSTRFILRLMVLLAAVGALSAGCKKKEPPPPPPPPPSDEVPTEAPKAGNEFMDPVQQAKYEREFDRIASLYRMPPTGTPLGLQTEDGAFVGGTVVKIKQSGVTLLFNRVEQIVNRASMVPESQAVVYPDAFAREQARAVVQQALTKIDPPQEMFAVGDLLPRKGPGISFADAEGLLIPRGTPILVTARQDLWYRAKAPSIAGDKEFWITQMQAVDLMNRATTDYTPVIAQLQVRGIVNTIDTANKVAMIPTGAWVGLDASSQAGLARMLAAYCAKATQSETVWIQIKDPDTGRRLGSFSAAQGFRPAI